MLIQIAFIQSRTNFYDRLFRTCREDGQIVTVRDRGKPRRVASLMTSGMPTHPAREPVDHLPRGCKYPDTAVKRAGRCSPVAFNKGNKRQGVESMLMVSTNGIRSFNETGRAIYIPRFCPPRYDRCDKGELPRAVRHAYLISRFESAQLVQGHRFTSEMPNQRNSNVHADKVLNWSLVSVSCHVCRVCG